jgi:hypothetical protein
MVDLISDSEFHCFDITNKKFSITQRFIFIRLMLLETGFFFYECYMSSCVEQFRDFSSNQIHPRRTIWHGNGRFRSILEISWKQYSGDLIYLVPPRICQNRQPDTVTGLLHRNPHQIPEK